MSTAPRAIQAKPVRGTALAWLTPVSSAWGQLAARERRLVLLATGLVSLAMLWWVALAPALKTLAQAPARHAQLDAQLQRMQALSAKAEQLKNMPAINRNESLRALEVATTRHLGNTATLSVLGDQATVTLKSAAAEPLALWLADVRINARVTPAEARLTQGTPGANPAAQPPGPTAAVWSGTLTLALGR